MQALKKDARSVAPEDEAGGETIEQLLTELHSHDWKQREHARWQLVTLIDLAVFPLIDALEDPDGTSDGRRRERCTTSPTRGRRRRWSRP